MTLKSFYIVALFGFVPHLAAQENNTDLITQCKQWSEVSGKIMEYRQQGQLMSDIMGMFEGVDLNGAVQKIIVSAYELPRYSTDEYQERAIADFANDVFLGCVKGATE